MKSAFILTLLVSQISFAQRTLVCVSWMNRNIEIQEKPLTEFETATIHFVQDEWSYTADVMEGSINYVSLHYTPLQLTSTARATTFPLHRLSASLEFETKQASLDCEIR